MTEFPDPSRHADNRGLIEGVLRRIPGFRGYLEKGYRRESDYLARKWIADRLQTSKRGLDDCMSALVNSGKLDAMTDCEKLRSRLDRVVSKVRGDVRGYSAFFEFAKVNEGLLEDVYDHDVALMAEADSLAESIEQLGDKQEVSGAEIRETIQRVDDIERTFDQRGEMLNGLGPA